MVIKYFDLRIIFRKSILKILSLPIKNDTTFSVEQAHFIQPNPLNVSPFQPTNRKILCLTDIFLGENNDQEASVAKLNELLSNLLTGIYETDGENNPISHIVILGGIFHQDAWKMRSENDVVKNTCKMSDSPTKSPKHQVKKTQKERKMEKIANPESDFLKMGAILSDRKYFNESGGSVKTDDILLQLELDFYLEIFDQFLSNLLEMYPVTLLPGRNDLGTKYAPHCGISRSFFPESSKYKNFRCCPSAISDMKFTDEANKSCTILGVSAKLNMKNDDDYKKSLTNMLTGLLNNELLPGAVFPEIVDLTLTDTENILKNGPDMFLVEKVPELLILRNETRVSGKLENGVNFVTVSGEGPSVIDLRDLSVESFD